MRLPLIPALVGVAALLLGSVCNAQRTVFEDKEEILYLDVLADPSRWDPSEATVTTSETLRFRDRPTLDLHIKVDHQGGEKKYPIGWPRMYCALRRPGETVWTEFDRVEFWIQARMSRAAPPKNVLAFQVLCPDRNQNNTRNLAEIELGKWVHITWPTAALKHLPELARLGFNISESEYDHGDDLHFYIGGFRLIRSAECQLAGMVVRAPVMFPQHQVLPVELTVEGPPENVSRGIPFTLSQGEKVLRLETLPVRRGKQTLAMDVAELRLTPGLYMLTAYADDPARRKQGSFRVIASPWTEQEGTGK